jgi:hypothetical protein
MPPKSLRPPDEESTKKENLINSSSSLEVPSSTSLPKATRIRPIASAGSRASLIGGAGGAGDQQQTARVIGSGLVLPFSSNVDDTVTPYVFGGEGEGVELEDGINRRMRPLRDYVWDEESGKPSSSFLAQEESKKRRATQLSNAKKMKQEVSSSDPSSSSSSSAANILSSSNLVDSKPLISSAPAGSGAPQLTLSASGEIIVSQESLVQMLESSQPGEGMVAAEEESGKLSSRPTFVTSATYSRRSRADRWSPEETKLFFRALSMCQTDFSLINMLFPKRNRRQIKNKFMREESERPRLVEAALKLTRPFDINAFTSTIESKETERLQKQQAARLEREGSSSARSSSNPLLGDHESAAAAAAAAEEEAIFDEAFGPVQSNKNAKEEEEKAKKAKERKEARLIQKKAKEAAARAAGAGGASSSFSAVASSGSGIGNETTVLASSASNPLNSDKIKSGMPTSSVVTTLPNIQMAQVASLSSSSSSSSSSSAAAPINENGTKKVTKRKRREDATEEKDVATSTMATINANVDEKKKKIKKKKKTTKEDEEEEDVDALIQAGLEFLEQEEAAEAEVCEESDPDEGFNRRKKTKSKKGR